MKAINEAHKSARVINKIDDMLKYNIPSNQILTLIKQAIITWRDSP